MGSIIQFGFLAWQVLAPTDDFRNPPVMVPFFCSSALCSPFCCVSSGMSDLEGVLSCPVLGPFLPSRTSMMVQSSLLSSASRRLFFFGVSFLFRAKRGVRTQKSAELDDAVLKYEHLFPFPKHGRTFCPFFGASQFDLSFPLLFRFK